MRHHIINRSDQTMIWDEKKTLLGKNFSLFSSPRVSSKELPTISLLLRHLSSCFYLPSSRIWSVQGCISIILAALSICLVNISSSIWTIFHFLSNIAEVLPSLSHPVTDWYQFHRYQDWQFVTLSYWWYHREP